MFSRKLFFVAAFTLFSAGPALAACGGDIAFKPGASSGRVAGVINKNHYCDYRFRARRGQTLKITYPENQRPQVFLIAPVERLLASGEPYILPENGLYDMRVMLTRNDARKYATPQAYAVTVSITDTDPAAARSALLVSSLAGMYEGTAPCADCDGIESTLVLYEDGSYTHSMIYVGQKSEKVIQDFGHWQIQGGLVALRSADKADKQAYYRPEGSAMVPTDASGKPLKQAAEFTLRR